MFSLLSRKSSVILLSIILLSSLSLSLISYQFSNSVLQEILDIARQDTASNAQIQARSISLLLEDELDAINSNLKSVTYSNITLEPEALNLLLDSLQRSTQDITDFYLYVDAKGILVSMGNASSQLEFQNRNISQARFFSEALSMNTSVFGGLDEPFDRQARFYISYPLTSNGSSKFNGIVAAAIGIEGSISE